MINENHKKSVETACGGKIKDPSLYPSSEYEGNMVYFCTEACRLAFHVDPDRFMTGELEHPPD